MQSNKEHGIRADEHFICINHHLCGFFRAHIHSHTHTNAHIYTRIVRIVIDNIVMQMYTELTQSQRISFSLCGIQAIRNAHYYQQ